MKDSDHIIFAPYKPAYRDFSPGSEGHGKYVPYPVPSGEDVVRVRKGEILRKVIILDGQEATTGEAKLQLVLEDEARAEVVLVILGEGSAKVCIGAEICGENACLSLAGLFIGRRSDREQLDVCVHHRKGNSRSSQLFKGIAAQEAHCSFSGRIVVAPGADGTEAYQESHSILIGDCSRIDTSPQLEIYADDVRCSHGATMGKFDPEEIFYMASRGIPPAEAKVMQMISFISEVIDRLPDEQQREAVSLRAESAVRQLLDA